MTATQELNIIQQLLQVDIQHQNKQQHLEAGYC